MSATQVHVQVHVTPQASAVQVTPRLASAAQVTSQTSAAQVTSQTISAAQVTSQTTSAAQVTSQTTSPAQVTSQTTSPAQVTLVSVNVTLNSTLAKTMSQILPVDSTLKQFDIILRSKVKQAMALTSYKYRHLQNLSEKLKTCLIAKHRELNSTIKTLECEGKATIAYHEVVSPIKHSKEDPEARMENRHSLVILVLYNSYTVLSISIMLITPQNTPTYIHIHACKNFIDLHVHMCN